MIFSLIIGTLNRPTEIKNCLESLFSQTNNDFEIIIIDQSDNNLTEHYIEELKKENIIYRHVRFKGLSKARNMALRLCSGEYICLIDDDAYYNNDYLEKILDNIDSHTVISGFIFDTVSQRPFVKYNDLNNLKFLSRRSIIRLCPSAGLTIPMEMISEVGNFDELFGIGSRYQSGEETDLLLRGEQNGYKVKYIKDAKLKHPFPIKRKNGDDSQKRAQYLEGLGALLKKHITLFHKRNLCFILLENEIKLIIKIILHGGNTSIVNQWKMFNHGFKDYYPNQ